MVATILTAVFGTLLMGIYAKRPFAIAPYMGENAFVIYTVVKVLGYSWQTVLYWGTLLTSLNYFSSLLRALEIAEVETPTCLATSARGNPYLSTRLFAISTTLVEMIGTCF